MLVETSSGNLYQIKLLVRNKNGKTLFPKEIPKRDQIDLSFAIRKMLIESFQKTPG